MTVILSAEVKDPLWKSGGGLLFDNLAPDTNSYSHEIAANGGFMSAEFSIPANQVDAESWIDGLGRHIEVYDESLSLVWAGFVNEIEIVLGQFTVRRGPLLEVDNKVDVNYQTITYNTNGPIGGDPATTGFSSDTDSQDIYAIQENIISGGSIDSTQASELLGTYLAENSLPQTSQDLSLGSGSGEVSVRLSCLGYFHFLKRYYYTQVATAALGNLNTKLETVLTADPNSIFSTDYNKVAANTLQVTTYEDGKANAHDIIMAMVNLGDAADSRYTFGVYDDQRALYAAIPTSHEYEHRLADDAMRILDLAGNEVTPWRVRPSKWLFVSDFLVGSPTPASLREDPRMVFIESVRYNAPYGISISGGKTDKFAQKLARFGLGMIA